MKVLGLPHPLTREVNVSKTKTYYMTDNGEMLDHDPFYQKWLDGLNSSALDEEMLKTKEVKADEFDTKENRK